MLLFKSNCPTQVCTIPHGSRWPLEELRKEDCKKDLADTLIFGSHKGASAKPDLLRNLISKDIKHGYSLPISISHVTSSPGLVMAPMNIHMAQKTIDETGRTPVPKDRLIHDQSWKWSSGTSINSRVEKDLLQARWFGFCIHRIINWTVAA